MAATKGTSILIKVGSDTIGLTDNASFTINIGNEEITTFGDLWKATLPTVKDWSMSISGSYDKSDTGQDAAIWTEIQSGDGAIAAVSFTIGAAAYTGACCLTSAGAAATATGKLTYTASFTGNGAFSYA